MLNKMVPKKNLKLNGRGSLELGAPYKEILILRHFLGFMLVFKRKLNGNKYNIYIRNQHHISFNL